LEDPQLLLDDINQALSKV